MSEFMTAKDFAAKIEWEGGVSDALDYGLKHTALDPNDSESADLRSKWKEIEDAWSEVDALQSELNRIIEQII